MIKKIHITINPEFKLFLIQPTYPSGKMKTLMF